MIATENKTTVHPFELSGLGKAPFMYVRGIHQDRTASGTVVVGHINGCQVETKADGRYIIDVRHDDKPQSAQYGVDVKDRFLTLTHHS